MKVIQVVPALFYGDAVGNDILALDDLLRNAGVESVIYAQTIGSRIPKGRARDLKDWKKPGRNDVIIYHMAIVFNRISLIKKARCRKIAIYHNITPPSFF